MSEVTIIGAGIIGLTLARRLARAGVEVLLVERGAEPGREASWAAAGMLAPSAEAQSGEEPLVALGRRAVERYGDWIAGLQAETGRELDHVEGASLLVATDRDDAAILRHAMVYQQRLGLPVEWLTPTRARELEPGLGPRIFGAIESLLDHRVDNRKLVEALVASVTADPRITLVTGTEATLRIEHGRCTGVELGRPAEAPEAPKTSPTGGGAGGGAPEAPKTSPTGGGAEQSEAVGGAEQSEAVGGAEQSEAVGGAGGGSPITILCTGVWTPQLAGLPAALRPPVRPVKGQALCVGFEGGLELRHTVRTPRVYLVPRADGRLVVGATSEEKGFDRRLTAGGLHQLLDHAYEVFPAIAELPILETWTGLRPASRDNLPIIGPTRCPGLWMATGHYRNGILLAEVTAALLAEALLGLDDGLGLDLAPFAPARFGL